VGCLRQRSRGRPKPPLHGRGGSAGRAAPRAAGAPAAQVLAARLALIGGCRNAADAARVADLRALDFYTVRASRADQCWSALPSSPVDR